MKERETKEGKNSTSDSSISVDFRNEYINTGIVLPFDYRYTRN
jgi:hypothetical protein